MAKKTKSLAKRQKDYLVDPEIERRVRDVFADLAIVSADPKHLFSKRGIKKYKEMGATEKEKVHDYMLRALGFDNDYTVSMTVNHRYAGLSIELRRNLIKNFACTTHAEKVLVDAVVAGYIRTLRVGEAFEAGLEGGSLYPEKINYMSMLSKELDRANRHLLTAYQALVQLKRPSLQVTVKAQQAFVAQAQQFNASKKEELV